MTKRLIVIHTAECGESRNADQGILATLLGRELPVHRIFDADSEQQMLDIHEPSSGARGLPKADGVHYEHAGYAAQTPAEWADEYSAAMLDRSARRAAEDSLALDIPVVHVTGEDVRSGKGFCGHIDITNAYSVKGGHWDPGPSFPWVSYLALVTKYRAQLTDPSDPLPNPTPVEVPAMIFLTAETAGGPVYYVCRQDVAVRVDPKSFVWAVARSPMVPSIHLDTPAARMMLSTMRVVTK